MSNGSLTTRQEHSFQEEKNVSHQQLERVKKSEEGLRNEPNGEGKTNVAEQQWGELFVECLPWANIFVDSQLIETTPLNKNIVLSAGEHQILLTHPDFPTYTRTISIMPARVSSIKIHLDTLFGFLECNVFPWGEVYIDGKFFGHTPLNRPLKLFPGDHTLTFRNPKFPPTHQKIVVLQNDTLKIRHKFEL
jgi:serine/threonine-protein kinase